MGAPGTLIPADILSAKDSSLNSYKPKLNKIPTLQASKDSGGVSSRPKPLLGDYEGSSQTSTMESHLFQDRKVSPGKIESLDSFSISSGDTGVGTSRISKRVTPVNQLDLQPSLAIGASVYEGSRGANAVGDGLRMNVNVVPYNQNSTDDPKNLFADLNPFQMTGYSKASVQSKPMENKVDEFQREKNSAAPGRPPLPLMWKNRYANNEVPRKKENDFVEGLFPKINRESNDYNLPSLTSNNATTSEKVYSGVFKLSGNAYLNNKVNDGQSSFNTNPILAPSTSRFNSLSLDEDLKANLNEDYHKDGKAFQSDLVDAAKEHDNSETALHDHSSFMENNERGAGSPSSSVDSRGGKVDQMFEDVGECEIPWEDLVLGERIGLGNMYDWLYF